MGELNTNSVLVQQYLLSIPPSLLGPQPHFVRRKHVVSYSEQISHSCKFKFAIIFITNLNVIFVINNIMTIFNINIASLRFVGENMLFHTQGDIPLSHIFSRNETSWSRSASFRQHDHHHYHHPNHHHSHHCPPPWRLTTAETRNIGQMATQWDPWLLIVATTTITTTIITTTGTIITITITNININILIAIITIIILGDNWLPLSLKYCHHPKTRHCVVVLLRWTWLVGRYDIWQK